MVVFSFVNKVRDSFSEIENGLVDGIAAIGPWITPLPSAVLVANAVVKDLHWIPALGWVTAAIIESLGLTTVSTSLLLWDFNASKRKNDPGAPFLLAASLVGVYLVSTIGLTVFLDIFPELGRYAPALFPLLALVGAINLALRSGHRRRLSGIVQDRAERKAERQSSRQTFTQPGNPVMSNLASSMVKTDTSLDKAQAARKANLTTRMDNLLTLYLDNPRIGATEAARALNISRQTVYTYLDQLEASGRIHRNGKGKEVILK
ncbi:MAG: winged helix-turn-helix domain-containing protein [Chloroflexi bacterium]|nr:winged helix-turn-helix domain-containing protein [Chloroflexota bacterium]